MSLLQDIYRAKLRKHDDEYNTKSMNCLVHSYHNTHPKEMDPLNGLGGDVTLLASASSQHSTTLRFVGASGHQKKASLPKESWHSGGLSCSSYDTFSDESSCFSTEDDSSFAGDDEPPEVAVLDEAKENGFVLSLETIQKMRAGKTIAEVEVASAEEKEDVEESTVHPRETFKTILLEETGSFYRRSYLAVPEGFFVKGNVKAHTIELMTAVRQGDVNKIRQIRAHGLALQSANRFNESIVHTAARRGEFSVLHYLIKQAGVSARVCCDTGRNPLHDAAWSSSPSFDCIRLLVQDCPDLLGLTDSKNSTPLDYIPPTAYSEWNRWLEANREILAPRGLF